MSTETKGFAEYIVNQCEKNPRIAFFLIPLGAALAYWGISDASYYRSMRDLPTLVMKDVSVVSKTNDRGFAVPHITGMTGDKEVSIPVSPKAARKVQPGEELGYVQTSDNKYVLRSTLDSQLSSIYFSLGPFPINFLAIFGLIIAGGAFGWGAFAKPKRAET